MQLPIESTQSSSLESLIDPDLLLQVPNSEEDFQKYVRNLLSFIQEQPSDRVTGIVITSKTPGGAIIPDDVWRFKRIVKRPEFIEECERMKIALLGREDIAQVDLSNTAFGASNRWSNRLFFVPSEVDLATLQERVKRIRIRLKRLFHQAIKVPESTAIVLKLDEPLDDLEIKLATTTVMNLGEISPIPVTAFCLPNWLDYDRVRFTPAVELSP